MIFDIFVHVDAQVDFTTGILGADKDLVVTRRIANLVRNGLDNNPFANIFTKDTHGSDYFVTQEGYYLPVKHCIKDTPGWELDELIMIAMDETIPNCWGNFVIEKSSFGTTDVGKLIFFIMTMVRGNYVGEDIQFRIIFDGFDTDICVVSCAITTKAMHPEIEHCIKADACAGYQLHDETLAVLKGLQFTIL